MRFRYVNRTIVYFRLCNFFVFSLPIKVMLTTANISDVKIIFFCNCYYLKSTVTLLLISSIRFRIHYFSYHYVSKYLRRFYVPDISIDNLPGYVLICYGHRQLFMQRTTATQHVIT